MNNRPYQVLIADADADARKRLLQHLETGKFVCADTGDYHEALELLKQFRFEALVIDLELKGESGMRLALEQIRREEPPLVYFSFPQVDLRVGRELLKRDVDEVLYKPIDPVLLQSKLDNALKSRRALAPQSAGS